MKGRSDIPLILGKFRPSEPLTSTQVLSQCAAIRGGTVQRCCKANNTLNNWPLLFVPSSPLLKKIVCFFFLGGGL